MFNLKNLRLYRLSRDVKFDTAALQNQLSAMAFTPCGSQDKAKTGWVADTRTTGMDRALARRRVSGRGMLWV